MDRWEREIRSFDRNLRRKLKKIKEHEIRIPVDEFININNYLYQKYRFILDSNKLEDYLEGDWEEKNLEEEDFEVN